MIAPERKIEAVDRFAALGFHRVEATSFTNPKNVPQRPPVGRDGHGPVGGPVRAGGERRPGDAVVRAHRPVGPGRAVAGALPAPDAGHHRRGAAGHVQVGVAGRGRAEEPVGRRPAQVGVAEPADVPDGAEHRGPGGRADHADGDQFLDALGGRVPDGRLAGVDVGQPVGRPQSPAGGVQGVVGVERVDGHGRDPVPQRPVRRHLLVRTRATARRRRSSALAVRPTECQVRPVVGRCGTMSSPLAQRSSVADHDRAGVGSASPQTPL